MADEGLRAPPVAPDPDFHTVVEKKRDPILHTQILNRSLSRSGEGAWGARIWRQQNLSPGATKHTLPSPLLYSL